MLKRNTNSNSIKYFSTNDRDINDIDREPTFQNKFLFAPIDKNKYNYKRNFNIDNLNYKHVRKIFGNNLIKNENNALLNKTDIKQEPFNLKGIYNINYANDQKNPIIENEKNEIILKTFDALYSCKNNSRKKNNSMISKSTRNNNTLKNKDKFYHSISNIIHHKNKLDIQSTNIKFNNNNNNNIQPSNYLNKEKIKKIEFKKISEEYNQIIYNMNQDENYYDNKENINDNKKNNPIEEINKLKKDIGKLNINIKDLETNTKELVNTNKNLEKKYNDLKIYKDKSDNKIIELKNRIKELEIQNNNDNDEKDNTYLIEEKEKLENQIYQMKEENESLNKIIKEKDILNQELNEQIKNLIDERNELSNVFDKIKNEKKILEEKYNKFKEKQSTKKSSDINDIDFEEEKINEENEKNQKSENKNDIDISKSLQEAIKNLDSKKNEVNEKENLKEELDEEKKKFNNTLTYEGKIKDFNEFVRLFEILFNDFKPEQKEKIDALDKIKLMLNK